MIEVGWKRMEYPHIKNIYRVCINGSIKEDKEIIKPWISEKGYYIVALKTIYGYKKPVKLHRIIAYNFITKEIFGKYTVNHINGIKTDNSIYNLEVITRSDNIKHAFALGLNTPRRGELNGTNKYSEECIIRVCEMISKGYDNKYINNIIYKDFDIKLSRYNLHDIRRKRSWKYISDNYF